MGAVVAADLRLEAHDVAGRTTLDDRTKAQRSAAFHNNRLVAQATARLNGSNAW
jgi:hypothetical protein